VNPDLVDPRFSLHLRRLTGRGTPVSEAATFCESASGDGRIPDFPVVYFLKNPLLVRGIADLLFHLIPEGENINFI
jgi:hypothetical protein